MKVLLKAVSNKYDVERIATLSYKINSIYELDELPAILTELQTKLYNPFNYKAHLIFFDTIEQHLVLIIYNDNIEEGI